MSERGEIKKINNWFSFYFVQFDTSPPAIIEGRVHPIHFSNSVTRINAAGRTFREKKLFLQIMFWLALTIVIVYPFLDTDYFLPIALIFGPIMLLDYVYYCTLEAKSAKILLDAVEQENELFVSSGIRLRLDPYTNKLALEAVAPLTSPSIRGQLREHTPAFMTLHNTYGSQTMSEQSYSPGSSASSLSTVDFETYRPRSGIRSAQLVDASIPRERERIIPLPTSSQLEDTDTDIPSASYTLKPIPEYITTTTTSTSFVDPGMPEGIALSPPAPPPASFEDYKLASSAPAPRRSSLHTTSEHSLLDKTRKKGRRVSINDSVYVFPTIIEEGSADM